MSDPVARYAHGVLDGTIVANQLVRAACQRHFRDLEQAEARGIVWDLTKAQRAIQFFPDALRLAGGEHEGNPFELTPWQQFFIGSIFGWLSTDGTRRFRVVFAEIGKGNGKSPLAAGIGMYMLVADNEPRAEIYSAAVDKEQANVLFRDAVAMYKQSPALRKRLKASGGEGREWNLAHLKSGSFFRPISSESKGRGKSGPRPHCSLLDEVHEHPTNAMVEFSRAGTKGRRQALIVLITNSGVDRQSVCYHYHEYGTRILQNQLDDDSMFVFICGLDEKDDWRDELVWAKANPNLGVSITLKYLREQVREAVGMPSKQSIVKRLNFCVWVDATSPWIDGDAWRACISEFDQKQLREKLRGKRAFGGLDLSGKNDLTALVLAVPDDGKIYVLTFFWTPEKGLKDREERDRAPYTQWVREGYLRTTPGKSIDYAFAAKQVQLLQREFVFKELAFDRYRIDDFERELSDLDEPVTTSVLQIGVDPKDDPKGEAVDKDLILRPHGQGYRDMAPAVDLLESEVLNNTLVVERNPVMTMCSANAVLIMDPAGNRKFDKRESHGRIDGLVAAAMAKRCQALAPLTTKSFWE